MGVVQCGTTTGECMVHVCIITYLLFLLWFPGMVWWYGIVWYGMVVVS